MSADRDLAEAIHAAITGPEHVRHALDLWNYATRQNLWSDIDCLRYVLDGTSAMAIDEVLARRLREAARTGQTRVCESH